MSKSSHQSESSQRQPVTEDQVEVGTDEATPFVAIGATAAVIGIVFVLALALAALAYFLAA